MGRDLDWSSLRNIATNLLDANPIAIIVTAVIAFGFPILLHYLLYRKAASPPSTSFLLLGPSGAGKTALLSLVRLTRDISDFHIDRNAEQKEKPRVTKGPHSSSRNLLALRNQRDRHILLRHLPFLPFLSLQLSQSPRTAFVPSTTLL